MRGHSPNHTSFQNLVSLPPLTTYPFPLSYHSLTECKPCQNCELPLLELWQKPLPLRYFLLNKLIHKLFIFENAGELRIIILRRKKGARALQHTPHTTPHNSEITEITFAPDKDKRRPNTITKLTTKERGCQGGQTLGSCYTPQPALFSSKGESSSKVGGNSIKNATIPVIPKSPSTKHNKRVETFLH